MRAVNLLPGDLRAADRKAARTPVAAGPGGSGVGAYAVLGVLAALLVAVVLSVQASNETAEGRRELATVKAQQLLGERELSRLSPYGSFHDVATQRIQTVKQLAGSRFDWEQALRDLSRAIPADVTLDRITGTVTPGTTASGGGSANPLRAAISAPAVEITGCTSSQPAVARLLARLRAVDGVTRVSLSSSAKADDETGSAAATGDSASGPKAAGCGKGAPPKFEVVLFFEGSTAAPAASASAPAPAAGAAPAAAATPAAGATPAAAATAAPAAATPAAGAAAPAATPPASASAQPPTAPPSGAATQVTAR